jgi:hypothetical protein
LEEIEVFSFCGLGIGDYVLNEFIFVDELFLEDVVEG